MSVVLTNTYLVTVSKAKVQEMMVNILSSGSVFEVLNAHELGEEWDKVHSFEHKMTVDQKELEVADKVLKFYQPKGLLESFIDHRVSGSFQDILHAKKYQEKIKHIAHLLNQYIELVTGGSGQGEPTASAISDLKKELAEYEIDPDKISKSGYKLISAYHASLELDFKLSQILGKAFCIDINSDTYFAFFSVDKSNSKTFENSLSQNHISFEQIDWNKEIVVWKNKGGLAAFQGVAESLGTIDSRETDPTVAISVFFTLFFAFCLGDAIYGLILAVFCGYFLYFKKLKPGFTNIFRLFFYSGIVTVLMGALMNSWAGDLLVNSPLKSFVEAFQVVDLLNPDSPAILNVTLKQNGGISPIVFMLGLSIVIGLANILTGYILKMLTSLRSKNFSSLSAELVWFIFIVSIVSSITLALIAPALATFALFAVGLSGLGLFIFNESTSISGKIFSGLVSIYNLISFFADILSFTRLIAVGLTSGIVANVINLLAKLVFDSIGVPVVNVVAAILVLIVGHVFNLVVALFGAYINPLRLHYVEFMPKFFEGRGRSLNPVDPEFSNLKLNYEVKN